MSIYKINWIQRCIVSNFRNSLFPVLYSLLWLYLSSFSLALSPSYNTNGPSHNLPIIKDPEEENLPLNMNTELDKARGNFLFSLNFAMVIFSNKWSGFKTG